MIITKTPLRISFVGGGSDLKSFYAREPGAVVSTAIDKYIYIFVNKKFDSRIRASYSKTEIVDHVGDLKHDLIRESLKLLGIRGGIEITSISDIPSEGSGLGSSSSYVVGLLHALHVYKGEYVSAERLAREACHIEINCLGKPIGKQDQYAAAYGGFNYIRFNPDESVFVEPIIMNKKRKDALERNMLLFYTGIARSSSSILSKQKKNMERKTTAREGMHQMVLLARTLRDRLLKNDTRSFGQLLHDNWVLKKSMADTVSSAQIDTWYTTAKKQGALGGKILGAGGGGFFLVFAPVTRHAKIIHALSRLKLTPVHFEPQGSRVIYVEE